MDKRDIKNLSFEELKEVLQDIREFPYRARQIFYWIYNRGVLAFDDMANLPDSLRDTLKESYYISGVKLKEHLKSRDGTEKFLFELCDGNFVESVFIPSKKRRTLCLSTQVGCRFSCRLCASGSKGFIRNLTTSEILDQVLFLMYIEKYKMTNFVFMGMGEPLDNYRSVSKAITIMNSKEALGIGARRITVSTCGLIPGIKQCRELKIQVNLSISLHATEDRLRNFLMPVNKKYPLQKLILACQEYVKKTDRRITLEYVLIKGLNNSKRDIERLCRVAKTLKAKINLIPYSPLPEREFESPSTRELRLFKEALSKKGVNVTLRASKGLEINAACGQLALHSLTKIEKFTKRGELKKKGGSNT